VLVTVASSVAAVGGNVYLARWTDAPSSPSTLVSSSPGHHPVYALSPLEAEAHRWAREAALIDGVADEAISGVVGGGLAAAPPPSAPPPSSPSSGQDQILSLLVYIALGCLNEVLNAMQTILLTLCALRASRRLSVRFMHRCDGGRF